MHQLRDNMASINELVGQIQDEKLQILARFLQERVTLPESFVVMLGETSSGKSSIINGLFQEYLLQVSASPTTGTVVEVMDGAQGEEYEYYVVNRDATLDKIDRQIFLELSKKPDPDVQRLRIKINEFPYNMKGLRLIDTPGYGSINENHDEVLHVFLPNSDVVIYTIAARVGMQQNDHVFMQEMGVLLGEDTDIFLLVNRVGKECNPQDRRIREIKQYAEDCLHRELPLYLAESAPPEENVEFSLPRANKLWEDVEQVLNSEKRQKKLFLNLAGFQLDLLEKCSLYLEARTLHAKSSEEQKAAMHNELQELMNKKKDIEQLLDSGFERITEKTLQMITHQRPEIVKECQAVIEDSSRWSQKDQLLALINNHTMPHHVQQAIKKIQEFLFDELNRLNENVHDMLNTAVMDFERRIELKANIYAPLVRTISKKLGQEISRGSLLQFFGRYGGQGGPGAGVANAAKKGLKAFGDMFGKTYNVQTHNALVQFLKKIGATSPRVIAMVGAVLVEGLTYLYDVATWQKKLLDNVEKSMDLSMGELKEDVQKYLVELKEHNKTIIRNQLQLLYDQIFCEHQEQVDFDFNKAEEQLAVIEDLKTKIQNQIKEVEA